MAQSIRKGSEDMIADIVKDEDGNVTDVTINRKEFRFVAGNPGEFVIMYTAVLNIISRWELPYASVCLYALLLEMYADSAVFSINKIIRAKLAERTGKSESTFINCTRELVGKKLIIPIGYKLYRLSPIFAFKGRSDQQRAAVIELYDICPDCINKETAEFFKSDAHTRRRKAKPAVKYATREQFKKVVDKHGL